MEGSCTRLERPRSITSNSEIRGAEELAAGELATPDEAGASAREGGGGLTAGAGSEKSSIRKAAARAPTSGEKNPAPTTALRVTPRPGDGLAMGLGKSADLFMWVAGIRCQFDGTPYPRPKPESTRISASSTRMTGSVFRIAKDQSVAQ